MESPKTFLEAVQFFQNEQFCVDAVAAMRWPDGPTCPECEAASPYYLKTQKRWKCRECRIQFSVKRGTIFEDSPVSLTKWLPALWLLCNCKNGVSSYEIARDLGVTQKTAWFMLHRLREAMKSESIIKMGGDGSPVELDESWVGGAPKNRHKSKRPPKLALNSFGDVINNPAYKNETGAGTRKTPVFGMLDREARKVRARVIPHVSRAVLQNTILDNVSKGSRILTDEQGAYRNLSELEFVHEAVNHMKEYVRGDVHTNGLENFWSLLKRGLRGTYVAVEPFHLDRYVTEQVFRYNNRATKDNPLTDADRFALALSQVANKRLTYAELTGKLQRSTEF
jgi:transposase-like protein